jgi:hypothetical protein
MEPTLLERGVKKDATCKRQTKLQSTVSAPHSSKRYGKQLSTQHISYTHIHAIHIQSHIALCVCPCVNQIKYFLNVEYPVPVLIKCIFRYFASHI